MTKLRAPLSVEQALSRIAGLIPDGYDGMSAIVDRTAGHIRAWGDPDREDQIPIDCAIALDLAYIEAGGEGAPIHEAYTHRLEMAALATFADGIALGRHAADTIRECGEAGEALVLAAQPGATPADRQKAEREVGEALEQLKRTFSVLVSPQTPSAPIPSAEPES